MPSERYFSDQILKTDTLIKIYENEFHHLTRVMRAREGDLLEIVNGKGTLAKANVIEIKKDHALLNILEVFQEPTRTKQLILAQAIPKSNRLDYILEKGTELGVDVFRLFPGELSVKKELFPNQLERAQSLVIAAMKQCGRLTLPEILMDPPLSKWQTIDSNAAFFGDVSSDARPLKNMLEPLSLSTSISSILFFTGPESGFTQKEELYLKKLGVQGVKLHENILRTDTASIMALAIISHSLNQ